MADNPGRPTELWRVNLPGQAIVRCLVFEQAGVWGVALKVNNQTEDVVECATREEAVRQGEEWRREVPSMQPLVTTRNQRISENRET